MCDLSHIFYQDFLWAESDPGVWTFCWVGWHTHGLKGDYFWCFQIQFLGWQNKHTYHTNLPLCKGLRRSFDHYLSSSTCCWPYNKQVNGNEKQIWPAHKIVWFFLRMYFTESSKSQGWLSYNDWRPYLTKKVSTLCRRRRVSSREATPFGLSTT